MGEWADAWSAENAPNIWGTIPKVVEMQSEGVPLPCTGAMQPALFNNLHGLSRFAPMIPNMYKIAGELTPTVFHIAARSLAAQALSILATILTLCQLAYRLCHVVFQFCARNHGFGMIALGNFEAPPAFMHFFDGFRTSHEVAKLMKSAIHYQAVIGDEDVMSFRNRAESDHPVIRGTAQNPDVYFQGRETCNPFYAHATNCRRLHDKFYQTHRPQIFTL